MTVSTEGKGEDAHGRKRLHVNDIMIAESDWGMNLKMYLASATKYMDDVDE